MSFPSRSSSWHPPHPVPRALLPRFPGRGSLGSWFLTALHFDGRGHPRAEWWTNRKPKLPLRCTLLRWRLWMSLRRGQNAWGCGARRPPGRQARGRRTWGAGRRAIRVETALCCGPLPSPPFKLSPLGSLPPWPPSERTIKEKKTMVGSSTVCNWLKYTVAPRSAAPTETRGRPRTQSPRCLHSAKAQ